ncbi:MAG: YIP1 family protein [Bdellovibrionaceae bacterium]|nr:YIP1 family protein [Pseudobdellovibrionaceae bacterium]
MPMRDVTESGNSVRGIFKFIVNFLKHPIRQIVYLPDWPWRTLIWVQIVLSMISGVLASLTRPNIFGLLFGLIVMPIMSMLMVSLLTAFLYYYFQVFEKKSVSAAKLFTLSLFSSIPFFVFQIASTLLPPITLIGFAFSAMLLAVGLSENFQIEKKRAVRLCLVLFSVVLMVWIGNRVSDYRSEQTAASTMPPPT